MTFNINHYMENKDKRGWACEPRLAHLKSEVYMRFVDNVQKYVPELEHALHVDGGFYRVFYKNFNKTDGVAYITEPKTNGTDFCIRIGCFEKYQHVNSVKLGTNVAKMAWRASGMGKKRKLSGLAKKAGKAVVMPRLLPSNAYVEEKIHLETSLVAALQMAAEFYR